MVTTCKWVTFPQNFLSRFFETFSQLDFETNWWNVIFQAWQELEGNDGRAVRGGQRRVWQVLFFEDRAKLFYNIKKSQTIISRNNLLFSKVNGKDVKFKQVFTGGTMSNFCPTPHSASCQGGEGLAPFASLRRCRCFEWMIMDRIQMDDHGSDEHQVTINMRLLWWWCG